MSTEALPAATTDEGRMTLMQHLLELRRRIIFCCVAVAVAAVAGWFLYPIVFRFLLHPYRQIASRSIAGGNLLVTSPLEGFAIRLKLTAYLAIALAMPVIAIVVAVATPSNDPFSMLALSVPLWLFYGVAVLFGMLRDRRRRRAAAKAR